MEFIDMRVDHYDALANRLGNGPAAEVVLLAVARKCSDHAVLSEWSNDDIKDTVADIKSTPLEILIDTPIGPFLFLSTIAIAQDGDGNLLVGIQKLFEPR